VKTRKGLRLYGIVRVATDELPEELVRSEDGEPIWFDSKRAAKVVRNQHAEATGQRHTLRAGPDNQRAKEVRRGRAGE